MKYKKLIKVNENFQYSVNLQFDINDINKIIEYIPTKDSCELLNFYFNSILNPKDRATTLIGPYGKGKSHLLLVLISLLNNYDESDKNSINTFLDKLKTVDNTTYNLLIQIRKEKIKLMPIIINSNYGDLNQAFLLGMAEALERESLSSIIVNTYFDIALNVILKWEQNHKELIKEIENALSKYDCNLKQLKIGLKNFSEEHYNIFKNVYSYVLHGQEFNPLVNSDIIKIYKDLSHELKDYGYSGIFIVFDEFSKFLEYSENTNLMKSLKLLQDFAELSNRTGITEQIHICCITHKTVSQYTNNLTEDKINAFKTVEGRFKEVYFNRSIEQNYEIISYAINKTEEFDEYFEEFFASNCKFYLDIKELPIFSNVLNIEETLFKGCFPLNPLTSYCLIQLSEKIAQNERTLFTFLSDDDRFGLKNFVENSSSNLFNVNSIYDYFKPIFKKSNDEIIRDIWIKAENSLDKCSNENEKNIIKTLAILNMLQENELITANDDTVKLSLMLNEKEYNVAIESLIEKSVIKRRKIVNTFEFTNIYNRELSKEIKKLSEEQFDNIDIKTTINEILPKKYSLPRRYNDEYKITRFFENIFLTEEELLSLNNLEILYDNRYCDGIIINLIKETRNTQEIKDHFQSLGDDKTVLKIPKGVFPKQIKTLLKEYMATIFLINNNTGVESIKELDLIKKENVDILTELLIDYFSDDNIKEYLYLNKGKSQIQNISQYLSEICFNVYDKTPIINNEMINKKDLSAPIKKARNIVIDVILNDDLSLIKSKTSAEATIYKAIVEKKSKTSINDVLVLISKFIEKSDNNRISFEELYQILENKPYSIRKGIIPILLAMALYNYSNIIIIYFMNKEIDLDAENLVKINDNPEKYYILTEKGTREKNKYLYRLMELFDISNINNQRLNLKNLVDNMRRWILSLPRILREYSTDFNNLNIDEKQILIKNELLKPDINNNEFIYQIIPKTFETDDYELVVEKIKETKTTFDNFMNEYETYLITTTKSSFNSQFQGSLYSLLKEWSRKHQLENLPLIYNFQTKAFVEYVLDLTTHNDNEIIREISKLVTGYYVDDWQSMDIEKYKENLQSIINEINKVNIRNIDTSNKITLVYNNEKIEKYFSVEEEISSLGSTLKNNIEEILSEYGESLTEHEKVNILIDIIKKYL